MPKHDSKKAELTPAAVWVKAARKHLGLTQAQFAERLGVHWVTVSNWERAKSEPDKKGNKVGYNPRWDQAEKIRSLDPALPAAPGVLPPDVAARVDSRPRTLEAAEVASLIDSMTPELRVYVRDTVYRILSTQSTPIPPTPPPPSRHS